MGEALFNVFTNMGLAGMPYRADALLKEYLPDSLALVLFVVEAEKVFQVSVPPGGFNMEWMDKSLFKIQEIIKGFERAGVDSK